MELVVGDLFERACGECPLGEVEFDGCGVVGPLELLQVRRGVRITAPFLVFDEDVFGGHPSYIYNSEHVVYPSKSKIKRGYPCKGYSGSSSNLYGGLMV